MAGRAVLSTCSSGVMLLEQCPVEESRRMQLDNCYWGGGEQQLLGGSEQQLAAGRLGMRLLRS